MRRLLCLLIVSAAALAVPATASEPESGKVSRAAPKTTWEGAVTSFQSWQTYNSGMGQCLKPSCDTFGLEVADAGLPLRVTVESGDSTMFVEIVKPDGSKELFGGETKATFTVKNAPAGSYTINVAQNESTTAVHKGTAELILPAPAPAPAPAPVPGPAPPSAGHGDSPAPTTLSLKPGRRKGLKLPVKVTASAPVTRVAATLLRGSKVVGKGSLARVDRSATLKLKLKGKLRRGTYSLRVSAVDGFGRTVKKTIRLKL